MSILEIIHCFFAGITFSVGVMVGAVLCRLATKEGQKEALKTYKEAQKAIGERLTQSLRCHERMADAMEVYVKHQKSPLNEWESKS